MRKYIPEELQKNSTFIKAEFDERRKMSLWQKNNSNSSLKRKLPSNSSTPPNTKKQNTNTQSSFEKKL
jgi:hypothetical protein